MPRESQLLEEPVRTCASCHRAKSIRGVWYLLPGAGATPFVCETCFSSTRAKLVA